MMLFFLSMPMSQIKLRFDSTGKNCGHVVPKWYRKSKCTYIAINTHRINGPHKSPEKLIYKCITKSTELMKIPHINDQEHEAI